MLGLVPSECHKWCPFSRIFTQVDNTYQKLSARQFYLAAPTTLCSACRGLTGLNSDFCGGLELTTAAERTLCKCESACSSSHDLPIHLYRRSAKDNWSITTIEYWLKCKFNLGTVEFARPASARIIL